MKTLAKVLAAVLLLINGAGAVYGGVHLMLHPDGSSLQLSPQWIEGSVFSNYFIPGVVLFIMNGLFSFTALALLLFGNRWNGPAVLAQGSILAGWLVIQVLIIHTVHFLHLFFGTVALLLILCGLLLSRQQRTAVVSH